ncbi:hypothetical protein HNR77_004025, partial [Paenibacillus sp. JGP012]|uniref:hypothetical protein n=1 Tax=Paenibacillus sp. JGP012 TaxID=2735914 RepID=UPI00161F5BE1
WNRHLSEFVGVQTFYRGCGSFSTFYWLFNTRDKRYIFKKLEKYDSPDVSMKLLVGVASALINIGNPQIEEFKLNELLNLEINQIIPSIFFADSLLYKYTDLNGRSMIGFYFSGIRDYIISVLCLKLDLFSNEERENIIKQQALVNYVGESSTKWFF